MCKSCSNGKCGNWAACQQKKLMAQKVTWTVFHNIAQAGVLAFAKKCRDQRVRPDRRCVARVLNDRYLMGIYDKMMGQGIIIKQPVGQTETRHG